jgi:hypothetical protein
VSGCHRERQSRQNEDDKAPAVKGHGWFLHHLCIILGS